MLRCPEHSVGVPFPGPHIGKGIFSLDPRRSRHAVQQHGHLRPGQMALWHKPVLPHAVHQTGIVGGIDIREIPDLLIGHIHIAVRLLYRNCDGNGLMVLLRQGDGALIDPHRTGKAQLQNGRLCGVVLVAGPGKAHRGIRGSQVADSLAAHQGLRAFQCQLLGELIDQTAISGARPAGDGQSYCDALLVLHGHDLGNSRLRFGSQDVSGHAQEQSQDQQPGKNSFEHVTCHPFIHSL